MAHYLDGPPAPPPPLLQPSWLPPAHVRQARTRAASHARSRDLPLFPPAAVPGSALVRMRHLASYFAAYFNGCVTLNGWPIRAGQRGGIPRGVRSAPACKAFPTFFKKH